MMGRALSKSPAYLTTIAIATRWKQSKIIAQRWRNIDIEAHIPTMFLVIIVVSTYYMDAVLK